MEASKNDVPTTRSRITISRPKATNWVAVTAISDAPSTDQTKIGIRIRVIPGARSFRIVVVKFSPPNIDESPKVRNASRNKSWPLALTTLSGG